MLAHLSDPHLAPLPRPRIAELASKRLSGYLNWLRKRRAIHRSDALAAIMRDLAQAGAGPRRGDRRSRQHRAAGRIRTRAPLARSAGAAGGCEPRARKSRRVCQGADALCERHWAPYMAGDAAAGTADSWGDDRREARLLPLPARGERVGVRGPTHTLEPSKLRLADRPRCTLQPLRLAERPPHPARKSAPTSPRSGERCAYPRGHG